MLPTMTATLRVVMAVPSSVRMLMDVNACARLSSKIWRPACAVHAGCAIQPRRQE
jgi:hypothetical protein